MLPSLHDSQVCEPGWSGNKMENIVPVRQHLQIGGGTPYTGSNDTSEMYREGNFTSDTGNMEGGR